MDIVEIAKSEMESGIVAYMEFALDYRKDENIVYCFYEGYEDRSFYSHRVKFYFHEFKYLDYITIGKGNLLKILELVENHLEYSKSIIGYFVDKDFEDEIENIKVFTSPTYSIENLFVTDTTFENILINEFGISHRNENFLIAIGIFQNLKTTFLAKSLILNAWLSCQFDIRMATGASTRLNIDKTIKSLLDKTVNVELTDIIFPNELISKENIENLFSTAETVSQEILQAKIAVFQNKDLEKGSRGKFLIKFLVSFLNRLQDEIGKNNSTIFSSKHTCPLRFEFSTCISVLTNNVDTPPTLLEYFQRIKDVA